MIPITLSVPILETIPNKLIDCRDREGRDARDTSRRSIDKRAAVVDSSELALWGWVKHEITWFGEFHNLENIALFQMYMVEDH